MADTAIAITAGSGTNVDTRTEATNGNHRQVVVLGDPSTNAGVAPVDATAGLKVDLGADNDVAVSSIAAGDNNIGNVDIASIAAGDNNIGNVDIASALPAGTNNIGDVDVLTVPADPFGANADAAVLAGAEGSIQAKLRLLTSQLDSVKTAVETLDNAISGSEMQVDVVGALPAGTNAIGKLAANTGVTIGAVEIAAAQTLATVTTVGTVTTLTGGGIAHDSADSGNPVKIGGKAKSTLSGVTLVASDDRADGTSDLDGAFITRNNYALGDLVSGNASNTDGSSTQVLAAGAAGIKHYITDVTITNMSATNIYVELKDNTTVKWTFPVPATSGVTHHFASPLAGTAATAWNFDPSAAATTIYCSVSGFKSKI